MGYTMDFTGGVWVGDNNNSPMAGIDGVRRRPDLVSQHALGRGIE